MTNVHIEELYSSFVEVVAAESKMLEHVDTNKAHNSHFIGLYGITKENYAINYELAEALKRILKDPFIAELFGHIESTNMDMGNIISYLSKDSEHLATCWSEMGGRGPGHLILDYCYQPRLSGSFPHLAYIILLKIKRNEKGYKFIPCDRQKVLWAVEGLLSREGINKKQ